MNSNTAIYLLHKNSNTYTIGMNLLLMHIFDNFLTKSSYESTMIFENAFMKCFVSDIYLILLWIAEGADIYLNDADMHLDEWESILFKLNDSKRYRRTVGSIASSCLTAATPLVASVNQAACLVALDIVEVCFWLNSSDFSPIHCWFIIVKP